MVRNPRGKKLRLGLAVNSASLRPWGGVGGAMPGGSLTREAPTKKPMLPRVRRQGQHTHGDKKGCIERKGGSRQYSMTPASMQLGCPWGSSPHPCAPSKCVAEAALDTSARAASMHRRAYRSDWMQLGRHIPHVKTHPPSKQLLVRSALHHTTTYYTTAMPQITNSPAKCVAECSLGNLCQGLRVQARWSGGNGEGGCKAPLKGRLMIRCQRSEGAACIRTQQ